MKKIYKDFFEEENKRGEKNTRRWLNKNRPDILSEVDLFLKSNPVFESLKFGQQLYAFVFDLNEIPKCKLCQKPTGYDGFSKGFRTYCSNFCTQHDPETLKKKEETNLKNFGEAYYSRTKEYKERNKQTCLEKYGTEHAGLAKDSIKKRKATCFKKYGTEEFFASTNAKKTIRKIKKEKYGNETFHNPEKAKLTWKRKTNQELEDILNKKKKTNFRLYGNEYANRTLTIKQKNIENTKKAMLKLYGVENIFMSEDFKSNLKKELLDKIVAKYGSGHQFLGIEGDIMRFMCKDCHTEFTISRHLLSSRGYYNIRICTKCFPENANISGLEKEVFDFVKSIYPHEIVASDRTLIKKELDIYIPEKKLAIEFDGLFWHSDKFLENSYHLDKLKLCHDKNIKLIHIFEDEWRYKQNIVKSMIAARLGLAKSKIHGRNCQAQIISYGLAKKFLNKNHLQGTSKSSTNLGLFHDDELVTVMSFSKTKSGGENDYELTRFASKINTRVVGAAGKLFSFFLLNYEPNKVISFSDLRWSDGELYEKLEFECAEQIPPSYWYVIGTTRKHRFNFRKKQLQKEGYDITNKTEKEIMSERGIYRIYDCGLLRWEYSSL